MIHLINAISKPVISLLCAQAQKILQPSFQNKFQLISYFMKINRSEINTTVRHILY